MRYSEFTQSKMLQEYRRDKTAQAYGDRLIQALAGSSAAYLPDSLVNAQTLAIASLKPGVIYFPKGGTRQRIMNILGTLTTVGQDNATEVLQQMKPTIVAAILAEIEGKDTSPNKEYSEWLARVWANDNGKTKLEDLNNNDLLGSYTMGKRRRLIAPEHADLNKFKTWKQFEDTILLNYDADTLRGTAKKEVERGDASMVYDDADVRIMVPNDERASCYYGQNTRWCTAATRSTNYFDRYNSEGKLYILLPKKPQHEGEKYQIHFPKSEFMDETNKPVDIYDLLVNRFPGVLAYFKKVEPDNVNNIIVFADDQTLEPIIEKIKEYGLNYLQNEIHELEDDDEDWQKLQSEEAIERGYVTSEGYIDWERVRKDDELNVYPEYNLEVGGAYLKARHALKKLTSKQVREAAAKSKDYMSFDSVPTINKIEYVIYYIIRQDLGKNDYFNLSNWVANKIYVYKDNAAPNGKTIWKVDFRR